jgi:hypothetical protein
MIARLTRTARKLRGRAPAELRERGAQALAAWRERTGLAAREIAVDDRAFARRLAAGAPRDPAALLAAFRGRAPRFAPGLDDPTATVAALAAWCPADRADALARADGALAGRFDLLGYQGLSYGDPVDWQRDPVHDRRASAEAHWSRVPYLDAAAVGDHKVTWEVNRQQYLVALGQAWHYTGDDRYARGFAGHVTAWMDANPPKRGINWASSLEVAFRAMSWVWALHLFRGADALTPALYARMVNHLHVHARHLERYLSTYFSPNTHLTGEALGLVHVGAFLTELAGAARWRRRGLAVLAEWLPRQVRADGGYFEQATQYHRYTAEFALHLLVLDGRHGWGLGPALRPVVDRLFDYLATVTRPDGTIPLIGDDDGGRLVWLDGRPPDDVRGVLAQGAVVLDRPALAHAAGDRAAALPSALWLLGPDAAPRLEALGAAPGPAPGSRAFPDTGVYVMRGGGPGALHAVVDCGPHGVMNFGHAHADLLSVTASAGGRHLLVDSGTYSYPGPERNAFRGAGAHNVLLVDGHGSSEPAAGAFQWARVAHGRVLAWDAGDDYAFFDGDARRLSRTCRPVSHRRAVLFLAASGGWCATASTRGGEHTVRLHWHLAPGLRRDGREGRRGAVVVDGDGRPALEVSAVSAGGGHALAVEPSWFSPSLRRAGARRAPRGRGARDGAAGARDVLLVPAAPGLQARDAGRAGAARSASVPAVGRGPRALAVLQAARGGVILASGVRA